MKRVAEKQLVRDEEESSELQDSESNPGQGIQRASETVLAGRKIKPLPSRGGRTLDQPKPIFAGFSSPSPGSNPFLPSSTTPSTSVFSVAPAKPADARLLKPSPATFTYTPPPSTTISSSSASGLASAASNTSKAFASILNAPSSNIFSNSTPNPQPSLGPTPSITSNATNGTSESSLTSYYSNLRGLNICLLDFIKNSVETDPFADLTSVLESYKSHRSKVQKMYDDSSAKDHHSTSGSTTKLSPPSAPLFGGFGTKQPSLTPAMPDSKPPLNPIFGSTPAANLFAPAKAPGSSESTKPSPSTSVFGTPSGLLFGGASATTPASSTSGSSSGFSFGSSATSSQSTTGTSNVFGSAPTTIAFPFATPASTSAPSSNPFGPPATNLFNTSASSSSEPTSKTAFGGWTNSSDTDKKSTTIAFGSAAAPKNIPVSHPFASSPASTNTSTSTTPAPFGSEKESQDTAEEGTGEAQSEGATEGTEPTLGLLTPNPHDQEGKGEENEETVHAVKLKAYRMRKADEGGSGWAELGMGILRLKKDKVTGSRRVLLRNSTNGKITINFKIYPGLKPSIAKKALTFVGHSESTSQTYCVRLPNETQAEDLKGALEREIEFVKAKETS